MRHLLILALATACTPNSGTAPCGSPFENQERPLIAAITNTLQYDAGTLTLVDVETRAVCDNVTSSTPDSVIRAVTPGTFVDVGRLGYDRLHFFAREDWTEPFRAFALPRGSNPQDVVRCGSAWWVSYLDLAELRAYDDRGVQVASVDLSNFADADGLTETLSLRTDSTNLFAALGRLDRTNNWTPEAQGRVVEVNCDSATLTADWATAPNPALSRSGDEIIILGEHTIEKLDANGSISELLTLTGHPAGWAPVEERAVVVERLDSGWHKLYCFDGIELEDLGFTDAFINDAVAAEDGSVWLTARTGFASESDVPSGNPLPRGPDGAIWRIDPQQCQLTDQIGTDLLPYSLASSAGGRL